MLGPVRPTKPRERPPRRSRLRLPIPLGSSSRGSSSIKLFQAPQLSQRPVHFWHTAAHCWQTKRACGRAIGYCRTAKSPQPGLLGTSQSRNPLGRAWPAWPGHLRLLRARWSAWQRLGRPEGVRPSGVSVAELSLSRNRDTIGHIMPRESPFGSARRRGH
jgi:hypothetical protein